MSIKITLEKIKEIHANVLEFLEKDDDTERNYQNFIKNIEEQNIYDDLYDFTSLLNLIATIADNHYRETNFYSKIEKVLLLLFKKEIKTKLTDSDIFNIFKNNKKILLFLFEENIMKMNNYIAAQMQSEKYKKAKYPRYFFPEIKNFLKRKKIKKGISKRQILNMAHQMKKDNQAMMDFFFSKEAIKRYTENSEVDKNDWISDFSKSLPNNFYENRKIGENENHICDLIRKDLIEDFIIYVERENCPLSTEIEASIYETNPLLLKTDKTTLIEYASYYGSISIVQYLFKNGIKITPSLWIYAVHSNNPELIHLLEENDVKPDSYEKVFNESIKCHHNDVANYIKSNYLKNKDTQKEDEEKSPLHASLKSYNFAFIQEDEINQESFFDLCQYGHSKLAEALLEYQSVDVNKVNTRTIEDEYDEDDYTEETSILHSAIKNGSINIIKLLLSTEECDVNVLKKFVMKYPPRENQRDFYYENWFGTEWIEWHEFSDFGCKVMVEMTPLQYSIEMENDEIVKLLVKNKKVDVNRLGKYSMRCSIYDPEENYALVSPLHSAVEKENLEIIQLLLENDSIDANALNVALFNDPDGDGKHIQRRDRTALHLAIENESVESVELLLSSQKVDPNIDRIWFKYTDENEEWSSFIFMKKRSPLQVAIYKENIDIVKLLLNNDRIDVNLPCVVLKSDIYINDSSEWDDRRAPEEDPTFEESYLWDDIQPKLIDLLNECKYEKTPFFVAVENRCLKLIELFLNTQKVDVNLKSKFIETKVDKKKNINKTTIEEKTPLNFAIESAGDDLDEDSNFAVLKILLKSDRIDHELPNMVSTILRSTKNKKDESALGEEKQISPLKIAEEKGSEKIIQLLKVSSFFTEKMAKQ